MADDKKFFVKVLKVMGAFSSAAGMFCPISAMAGSIIQAVANSIDDEEIENLKEKFETVKQGLNEISDQIKQTELQIDSAVSKLQYDGTVRNLRKQFSDFMEVLEAEPGEREGKIEAFIKSYFNDGATNNINDLYRGVVKDQLFNLPFLQVPEKNSGSEKQEKEACCKELTHLFRIGLVAMMGYYAFRGDDLSARYTDWEINMNEVNSKIQAYLKD